MRLRDSHAPPLGVLAITARQGFADPQIVKSVMEAFAPRVAAELARKRKEDVRRENEERYRAFITGSPDAMWRIELRQPVPLNLPEDEQIERVYRYGYLAECNNALAHMTGAERAEDLVGGPFRDVGKGNTPPGRPGPRHKKTPPLF